MLRVLSLGAGVQSTTLLLMSELGELPLLDAAIFADTQSEPSVAFDDALRAQDQHIPGTHGRAYVHRSAIPLRLVDFGTPEDAGQQNLFAREECAGVCGT